MQERTSSAIAEIRGMESADANRRIENHVENLVGACANILAEIQDLHGEAAAEGMEAKIIAAIKARDADKFRRAFRNMESGK